MTEGQVQESVETTDNVELEEYTEDASEDTQAAEETDDGASAGETTESPAATTEKRTKKAEGRPAIEDGDEESVAESFEAADISKPQMDALAKHLGLPEEITYFQDKSGKWKFVVPMDGKKHIATFQEIFKGFNLNQVGYQRLNKAKEAEKNMQEYLYSMRDDPEKFWALADHVFKDTGLTKEKLAHQLLQTYVQDAELSPEERQQQEQLQEAERIKQENEQLKRQDMERQYQAAVTQEREKLNEECVSAMQKHGFKPFSDEETPGEQRKKCAILGNALSKVALAHQHGRDMSVDDALHISKQEWQAFVWDVFNDIEDDHIFNMLPDRVLKAIRKGDLKRLQGNRTPTATSGEVVDLEEYQEESAPVPRTKQKQTINEFFDQF